MTKNFPPSRERRVLLELLAITQGLKKEGIDAVVCNSKWVEMILDEMSLHAEERDREAQFVVRTMRRVVENL